MKEIMTHLRAGTGAVLVQTQDEERLVDEIKKHQLEMAIVAAPSGQLRLVDGGVLGNGLPTGYEWASARGGRILVVYDWHVLVNAPGHWRSLIEVMPSIRSPKSGDLASLVVFVAPVWELSPTNPLRGILPLLVHRPPEKDVVMSGVRQFVPDAKDDLYLCLAGLPAVVAEQVLAETLVACQGQLDREHLSSARRRALRDAGLEVWQPVDSLGGLTGFKEFVDVEILPWVSDEQLSVRRLLAAGLPGTGKSYCARWLAGRIGCECVRLSIPSLKASLVGQSEANLRRALSIIDGLSADSPMVVTIDEIDAAVQRQGLDSGVSSGLFSELLTWLQESTSKAVVLATLNHLDNLDAALESRFAVRFFFDLPTFEERRDVAALHFTRLRCEFTEETLNTAAHCTDGWSNREIAEYMAPTIARRSGRKPTPKLTEDVCASFTPASKTQTKQIEAMRLAAQSLRKANSGASSIQLGRRKIN